jgi:hypothetical protein
MKKNKDSKREPLPGSPEARPEGGRSKGDDANTNPDGRKSGKHNKAESEADDDGMPAATKNTNRNA